MAMLQPMAVALRAQGERNIMVQTRDISSEDVIKCSAQLMGQVTRCSPASKSSSDYILGSQVASFSQGVFEAGGRRFQLVYKMLNDVLVIVMVPAGSCVLTAQRVSTAVTRLMLIYFRSASTVSADRIFRKYPEIYCSLGAIVRDNGHDYQAAYLEGEGAMAQLTGSTSAKVVSSLLGIGGGKKARDASNRASDRYFQAALAEGSGKSKRSLVSIEEGSASASGPMLLPASVQAAMAGAQQARKRRLVVTEDAFTKGAPAADDEIAALGGVSLPGFRVPNAILSNRLADPEGRLRDPGGARREGDTEEEAEEEEPEPEVADEVEEEEEVLPEVMPGLGEAGDELTLVEKWHAVFNGLKLQSAGVQGLLLCNRPSLTCLFKLEVPPVQSLIEATEASQVDPKAVSFDEESQDALRLSVQEQKKQQKSAAPRPLLRYQLPAAALRPPFVAALQVTEKRVTSEEEGVPDTWEVYMRVTVKSAIDLPVPCTGGRLTITLPPRSPPIRSCVPKAKFAAMQRSIQFVIPAIQPAETFTVRAMLAGEASPSGPASFMTSAQVLLLGEPSGGTLSGTRLMQGNTNEELASVPGNYACLMQLQPIIRRVQ